MNAVCVAMSGGIDSSFAAHLLKKSGYKVIGITFQLLPDAIAGKNGYKTCCSEDAIGRAKKIADNLSIPHYVIDLRRHFKEQVIDVFIDEYGKGRTPNPCILCNREIKFSSFLRKSLAMGIEKVATGHYASIDKIGNNYHLKKGKDKQKDQSYFLYSIHKNSLGNIIFPLSGYCKSDIQGISVNLGWENRTAKESQDICFIPDKEYRNFLSYYVRLREGPIYHVSGTRLGTHQGIHLYTIGQRRGINIPYGEPLYVIEIIPDDNAIVVGAKRHLHKTSVVARNANFFESTKGIASAKTRYRQKEVPCSYEFLDDTLHVKFDEPVDSASPGQSVVLYQKNNVVGGGIIENSF